MTLKRFVSGLLVGLYVLTPTHAQKSEKRKITINGRERSYLFLPAAPGAEPAPLLVLLHGSGRDAASIFDPWQSLAKKERIVLVAPDSLNRAGWSTATDGPDFFQQVIDDAIKAGGIDTRRIYLFGHSAGGHHTMDLALLESEYFAGAAVHAGALIEPGAILPRADRKIPIGMWNGINDRSVPIDAARSTESTLKQAGFPVTLNAMPGHTHDYYGVAGQVNREAWEMLRSVRLSADPKFKKYDVR